MRSSKEEKLLSVYRGLIVYTIMLTSLTRASLSLAYTTSQLGEYHHHHHQSSPIEESLKNLIREEAKKLTHSQEKFADSSQSRQPQDDKRLFAVELLRMLHEQYGKTARKDQVTMGNIKKEDRPLMASKRIQTNTMLSQLISAIGADGDVRRLIDWVENSFNLASVGELTTQFVVSKLGSVNCAALLKPDPEETLIPRFLLFNEHFVDVPFELPINPSVTDCIANGQFDPLRKTAVLIHGYLSGYTLADGLTNIKNRILDLNKHISESYKSEPAVNGSNYSPPDELEVSKRQQQFNIIVVDWYNGANPVPRARYIRAAVNAQVVGQLIARFLSALVVQCRTPSSHIQIIAHSLGCHVAGFTGKTMNAAGHRMGQIIHLDPVGLCFGRLFSEPKYRLSPNDALETKAVHVSLNLFDNPLDGTQSNFLINGGRDQIGCDGQSELKNSTSSSVSLLWDSEAKFSPCSHLRALSLFEDDLSSSPGQCQMVGYKCANYDRFLAGKCGKCDASNGQCKLMSLPPIIKMTSAPVLHPPSTPPSLAYLPAYPVQKAQSEPKVKEIQFSRQPKRGSTEAMLLMQQLQRSHPNHWRQLIYKKLTSSDNQTREANITYNDDTVAKTEEQERPKPPVEPALLNLVNHISNGSIAWLIDDQELNQKIGNTIARLRPELLVGNRDQVQVSESTIEQALKLAEGSHSEGAKLVGVRSPYKITNIEMKQDEEEEFSMKRSDRKLLMPKEQVDRLAQTLAKISSDTRNAIAEGWTNLAKGETKYKVSSLIGGGRNPLYFTISNPGDQIAATATEVEKAAKALISASASSDTTKLQTSATTSEIGASVASLEKEPQLDSAPLGAQALPAGSHNGPLYFVGTGAISPYCVNYYQFRLLIAESQIERIMKVNGLAPNRLAHISAHHSPGQSGEGLEGAGESQRSAGLGRDVLHLTVKLSDSRGHFFKGFSLVEDARQLVRVPVEPIMSQRRPIGSGSKNMFELTMLLNTTQLEPVRISESIISYYFHSIVLADLIEVNYMSNISPE